MRDLAAYELVERKELPEYNGVGYVLSHKKTKARVLVIENDDDNKVFNIGFRTPPSNSKGVQHIIEHTVLCGSDKYPAKDPFVELAKGSLNTFLNAMTYPDKTVYPVASCNSKDFHNLMDVYLDAVFHPFIYLKEEIFKQEGWHYELEDKDASLNINGVVYNEMKGVYSSPDSVVGRTIANTLFKDSIYSKDSGGFPDDIIELSREEYLDYHRNYYHPSNSYIYLYGDMDAAGELEYIDEEYLSDYEYLYVPSEISESKPFKAPVSVRKSYSIADNDETENNTYLTYNVVVGNSLDKLLTTSFDILTYVLLDAPGAPLNKALIDAGICAEVESSYDTSTLQPVFSIIAHNADEKNEEKFKKIIEDTLSDLVTKGISEKSLEAAVNKFEFKHKEANFGRWPKGLMIGLDSFETWLYDDKKALYLFSLNEVFDELHDLVKKGGYFEGLIRDYILNNNYKAFVTVVPEKGLNKKHEAEFRKKLDTYKNLLSDSEIEAIVNDTKHLKQYQGEPTPAEDLEKIPLLTLDDIKKEARKQKNKVDTISDVTVVSHDIFTNGITYLDFNFSINDLDVEMYKTASLLCEIFKYVDTDSHTIDALSNEVDNTTGGIGFSTGVLPSFKNDKVTPYIYFAARTKCLDERIEDSIRLVKEILKESHITDKKRLIEIIKETKSSIKDSLVESGHITASQRALSYISPVAFIKENMEGLTYYRYLDDLEKNFEERYESLCESLKEVLRLMIRKENLIISYTSDKDPVERLKDIIPEFTSFLSEEGKREGANSLELSIKNEGFKTASKVQYVATAGNYIEKGYKYTGALNVLQMIFSYDYLWINVRVKGGAYGAMCDFGRSGYAYLTSYRDPNLMETYKIYKEAYKYVETFDQSDRDMLKYIIGAIAKMDTPFTPSSYGTFSFSCYLTGITDEMLQQERDEVLSCTKEDIRALSGIIKAITDSDIITAVGDEKLIEEAKDNFGSVENLY